MSSTRYPYKILIKLEFPQQIFIKYSNNKYHDNPSSGRCGRTDNMTKLAVAVCNFVNSPKKCFVYESDRNAIGKKMRSYGKTEADGEDGMPDNKHISKAGGGGWEGENEED